MVVKKAKPTKKAMGKSFFHTNATSECVKTKFNSLDDDIWYDGYTFGDTWNGWASPLFTFDVAKKVLQHSVAVENERLPNDDKCSYRYNKEKDVFTYKLAEAYSEPGGWKYEYKGQDIEYKGQKLHVYPIGAWEWCWRTIDHYSSRKAARRLRF